jgi:hypothetical protein
VDQFQREQDTVALRQLVEQTYANNPVMLDALRRNQAVLDQELWNLPPGSSPDTAVDRLGNHQWFREAAESEEF